MKHFILYIVFFIFYSTNSQAQQFKLPATTTQAIVALSEDWNSSHVSLSVYEKQNGHWIKVSETWQGRIGKNGSAWGRGISPTPYPLPSGQSLKKEGDWKAPTGVFHLGGTWGYATSVKTNPAMKYTKITPYDLWVEDKTSPYYNQHIRLKSLPTKDWEKKAQMRQGDHAHSLKLFIKHNAPSRHAKVTPGGGSAIFFHIWRSNGKKPTAGCTTMAEDKLKAMISLINPQKNPVYILMPRSEYISRRSIWSLP